MNWNAFLAFLRIESLNRLVEMHHTGIEYLYFKYKKLVLLETWVPYFRQFAALNHEYCSPYWSNVDMIDGTLTAGSRQGGQRNVRVCNRLDQSNFFNGDRQMHGFQTMAAFFPNGMIAMSDPSYCRTHASTRIHGCGLIHVLRDAAANFGIPFTVFGDAAFGSCDVVQCMVKNVFTTQMIIASTLLCPEFAFISRTHLLGRAIQEFQY